MKKVKITLEDYDYTCSDGCCTDYGTVTAVNGVELDFVNQDRETILKGVLEELGYTVIIESKQAIMKKPKITVTMQEIADLKGCTVEQLVIEK